MTFVREETRNFRQNSQRQNSSSDFTFDHVFGPATSQESVFEEISELVQSALVGYRVCIFAYGQTGSGKTHTMIGGDSNETMGMIPRSLEQIFEAAAEMKEGWAFKFTVSIIEIYNEACRDLLAGGKDKKLDVMFKPKVNLPGLTVESVTTKAQVMRLLAKSNKNRVTTKPGMNERSSRSHSVFTVKITAREPGSGATLNGVLNLVDLAGSERLSKRKLGGYRLDETKNINKSLSALSGVIWSLSKNEKHIPYRNSKLTTLLSDSLGSDSKIFMFVNVSPSQSSHAESISSLRFAKTVNQCHIGTEISIAPMVLFNCIS